MEKSEVDEILGPAKPEKDEGGEEGNELEMISSELIDAVHAKKPEEVAQALRAAFECMDSDDGADAGDESELED